VVVPDAFFKIIFDPDAGEALAFILENRRYGVAETLLGYQTTVDAVEALTGFDFFPWLPGAEDMEAEQPNWPIP